MGRGELKKFKIKVLLPAREDDRMTRREEWNKVGEKRSLKKKKKGWFFVLPPGTENQREKEKGEAEGMNEKVLQWQRRSGERSPREMESLKGSTSSNLPPGTLSEKARFRYSTSYRVRCREYKVQSIHLYIHEQEHWNTLFYTTPE